MADEIRRLTQGRNVDEGGQLGAIVVDTVGTAESMEGALPRLGPLDLLLVSRSEETVDLDLQQLVHRAGASFVVA